MRSPSPRLTGGVGDGAGVGIGWGNVSKHNRVAEDAKFLVINCAAKESRIEQSLARALGAKSSTKLVGRYSIIIDIS